MVQHHHHHHHSSSSSSSSSKPIFKKFKSSWIGVVHSINDIPTDDSSSLWIAEGDQALGKIVRQGVRDINTMRPYMRSSRFEEVASINDLQIIRILLFAYQRWISCEGFRHNAPVFAAFLRHNGLTIDKAVEKDDYLRCKLTDVKDMYGYHVHPSIGWFVHNARCKICSAAHSMDEATSW